MKHKKISARAEALGRIYGRHSHGYVLHVYGKSYFPGLSPTMCEARHKDWSWVGQHRDKGWPWQMTMERLTRHLGSREDARQRASGGYIIGHVTKAWGSQFQGAAGMNFGNPLRPIGFVSDRYQRESSSIYFHSPSGKSGPIQMHTDQGEDGLVSTRIKCPQTFDITVDFKNVSVKLLEGLGFPIGEYWEAMAAERTRKGKR